jgi:hypothetical protein
MSFEKLIVFNKSRSGVDFVNIPQKWGKIGRGKPSNTYVITFDMGKQLSIFDMSFNTYFLDQRIASPSCVWIVRIYQTKGCLFNVKVGQTVYPMPDYIDHPSVSYLSYPKGHLGPPTATNDRRYF